MAVTLVNAVDVILQSAPSRMDLNPTSVPVAQTISIIDNSAGTRTVKLTFTYTQTKVEATHLMVLWNKSSVAMPSTPSYSSNSGLLVFPIDQTSFIMDGLNSDEYYVFGLAAARFVDNKWNTTLVVSPTSSPDYRITKGESNTTGKINGVLASDITSSIIDFNNSNNQNSSPISIDPSGVTVSHSIRKNGSADIAVNWTWAGTESDIDGFIIYVKTQTTNTAYTLGQPSDITYNIPASQRSFTGLGQNAELYYTIGIRAYRKVDTNIATNGLITTAIIQAANYLPNANPDITATVGGQTAANVASTVTGTTNFRTAGAPTNAPSIGAITYTSIAQGGTVDITLNWTYTQGTLVAEEFLILAEADPTTVTTSSPIVGKTHGAARSITLRGVPADKTWRAGIIAKRQYSGGEQLGTLITSWVYNAQTVNITANDTNNVNGVPSSTVTTNASNGNNAATDTSNFRTISAPTNQPSIGTITSSSPTNNGLVDLTLTWSYTQGALPADGFTIYFEQGTATPTLNSPVLKTCTKDDRQVIIQGVPMQNSYKAGIACFRNTSAGVKTGAIVTAWTRTGTTLINNATDVNGVSGTNIVTASNGYNEQIKTITLGGLQTLFYPVVIQFTDTSKVGSAIYYDLVISRGNVHMNYVWLGSYTCHIYARAFAWGNAPEAIVDITQISGSGTYNYGVCDVISRTAGQYLIVYLRGGMTHSVSVSQPIGDYTITAYVNGFTDIVTGALTSKSSGILTNYLNKAYCPSAPIDFAASIGGTEKPQNYATATTNSANLVKNSDFLTNLVGWTYMQFNAGSSASYGINLSDDWKITNSGTAYIVENAFASVADRSTFGFVSEMVAVTPGGRYEISILSGAHSCVVAAYIDIFDSSVNYITSSDLGINNEQYPGGKVDSNYYKHRAFVTVPTNAASIRFVTYKLGTKAGYTSSYMFLAQASIKAAHANQLEYTAYSPGPATLPVNSVTGNVIASGAVTNTHVADNTLDASSKLLNNSLTAAKTAIAAIDPSSGNIAASQITAIKAMFANLAALNANLGTVTAGTLDTTGYVRVRGGVSVAGRLTALVANDTYAQPVGVLGYGTLYGVTGSSNGDYTTSGIYGNSLNGSGVSGSSNNYIGVSGSSISGNGGYGTSYSGIGLVGESSGTGIGVKAIASSNYALYIAGTAYINNNTLIPNLNANFLGGYDSTQFARGVYATGNAGTAYPASAIINFNCTVSGYQFIASGAAITLQPVSDSRLKFDIMPEIFGLEFITKLNPVTYRSKTNPDILMHGFIADNMWKFTGSFKDSLSLYNKENDIYGMDYLSLLAPIVNSIIELDQKNKALEEELRFCKAKLIN